MPSDLYPSDKKKKDSEFFHLCSSVALSRALPAIKSSFQTRCVILVKNT